MQKNYAFTVGSGCRLILEDVYGKVSVSADGEQSVRVSVVAKEEKVIENISVDRDDVTQVTVRGKVTNSGTTIISGGGSVSIGGSIRGGAIVTGRGGVVIVGGKVISGFSDGVTVIQEDEMPEIVITVPRGTYLIGRNIPDLIVKSLGGKCDLSLGGQDKAVVQDVAFPKIKCSGQSRCRMTQVGGDVQVKTRGQSSVVVDGNVHNVIAESSGQSSVIILGDCNDFKGEASGQSEIEVTGRVAGFVRKRSSGQSSIVVR